MPPRKKNDSVATSVATSADSSAYPSRSSSPSPKQSFRFFDLPAELRLQILEHVLHIGKPLDLDPYNYRTIIPRLALFLVSKRMHEEAHRVFYSQPMLLFPYSDRFFNTKKPLLSRLPPHYRAEITTFEIRLGKGWSAPPRCQKVTETLGLADCTSLRTLKIFVELDPSESFFNGFRGKNATEDTYKWFCMDLLRGLIDELPSLETVEIDAYIKRGSPLIVGLRRVVDEAQLRFVWGPLRRQEREVEEVSDMGALEKAVAGLKLDDLPRMVEASA
ncbi:hypothetical protein BAUCODRAFT_29823 [Baudoinia panamericana UAMH 10762]|uniref:F-box domain-containing protein n=1 Tax=Baudoinia panamericana (strain UAMH 10762) TaxID=717646 RepID=M2MRL6_BAUPA|nr:uncharacterized protein BAUCODRAFT_29823 [Baudoinia panamericana UAMH 10762]EMC99471.1 hypothetical protein BAUCODRAFT_29823 [Baudoinia panamericana UAMH 10762]